MDIRTWGLIKLLVGSAGFALVVHWTAHPSAYPFSYYPAGPGGAILIASPGALALAGLIELLTGSPIGRLEAWWSGQSGVYKALAGTAMVVAGGVVMVAAIVLAQGGGLRAMPVMVPAAPVAASLPESPAGPVRQRRVTTEDGTALVAARGDPERIKALLAGGADINAIDHIGWSLLHYAVIDNDEASVKFLLEAGADPNAWISNGATAMATSGCMSVPIAELLLSHGADVNIANDIGITPLHWCAEKGNAPVVALLLEHGAHIDAMQQYGGTALHRAVGAGQAETLRLLLEKGANPMARDEDQRTPFLLAAEKGQVGLLELFDATPELLNAPREKGITPLIAALYEKQNDAARWLIAKGADVNIQSGSGETALYAAATYGPVDMVRLLLDKGADPNGGEELGFSPFQAAEFHGNTDIAGMLRISGAHVEQLRCEWDEGRGVTVSVRRGRCPPNSKVTPLPG